MAYRRMLRESAIAVTATIMLLTANILPNPWGYYAALAVLLVVPGRGPISLVFSPGYLSLPERVVLTIVLSIASIVAVEAILLALGVRMDRTTVAIATIALVVISGAMRLTAPSRLNAANDHRLGWNTIAFCSGLIAVFLIAIVAGTLMRG